jgi:chemotaxis protein MotB
MADARQPIIIVKKNRGHGGGHHGGAWKVAYADFVTAMMAFFLVMWLVNQSKEVKASVASYFRDPGVFQYEHSKGMLPGGTPGIEKNGAPPVAPPPKTMVADADAKADRARLQATAEHIRSELLKAAEFGPLRDQIEVTVTAEGLRIELVERAGSSFFDSGSPLLRGESVRILGVIAAELGRLTNDIAVEGHTDSRPYLNGQVYGNWELSVDRANAARRVIVHEGLAPERIRAVRGLADTELHVPSDPFDPRNRRVSILVRSRLLDGKVKEAPPGYGDDASGKP